MLRQKARIESHAMERFQAASRAMGITLTFFPASSAKNPSATAGANRLSHLLRHRRHMSRATSKKKAVPAAMRAT